MMNTVKTLATIFLFICSTATMGQTGNGIILKPGTKLTYRIDARNRSYDCIVTVQSIAPYTYDYRIIDSTSGSVTTTVKGMRKATNLIIQFPEAKQLLDDRSAALIISNKMFEKLNRRRPFSIKLNEGEISKMGIEKINNDFKVMVNGAPATLSENVIRSKIKFNRKFIATGDEFFGFISSKNFPLVTRMKTDFSMELLSITSP